MSAISITYPVRCQRFPAAMLSDINTRGGDTAIDAEICIVGAGPAGIALALALADRGIKTVLVESGGLLIEDATHDLNRVEQHGKVNGGVSTSRYRALGGSTTRWGGQVLPFFPSDFGPRPWLGLPAWPISFDDMVPHYDTALTFFGLDAVLRDDRDVWNSWNVPEPRFDGLHSFLSWWCPRTDMGRKYRDRIARHPDLECILHATVTAIDHRDGTIAALAVQSLDGATGRVTARRYVFCIGAVETARLLLQPLADGTEPPWAKSRILGGYFQDHPGMTGATVRPTNAAALQRMIGTFHRKRIRYQPRMRLSEKVQIEQRTLNVGGIVIAQSDDAGLLTSAKDAVTSTMRLRPDWPAIRRVGGNPGKTGMLAAQRLWQRYSTGRSVPPAELGYTLGIQLEQLPQASNRIALSDTRDAFGQRTATLAWRIGDTEIHSALVYAKTVKTAFEESGLATVDIAEDLQQAAPTIEARMHDQAHHIGTARMGHSAREGVVDADLRIFGTTNGYVAGSAVFPTGSFSNPTHTIVALAYRLADHLAAQVAR